MKWYKVCNNLLQDQLWEDIGWITRVNVLILLLAWTTPVRRWRVFWIFLPETQSRVPNCTSLLCVRCSDEILFSKILEIGVRVPVQDISWKRRWPHAEFFKAVYRTPVSAYLSMYEILHCSWTDRFWISTVWRTATPYNILSNNTLPGNTNIHIVVW